MVKVKMKVSFSTRLMIGTRDKISNSSSVKSFAKILINKSVLAEKND